MNHDEVVAEVMARARTHRVLSHYCKQAQRCLGDRGLPDLLLAGIHGAAFAEIKTANCPTMSSGQIRWKYLLIAAGMRWFLWTEADLSNGNVDQVLCSLAGQWWSA